MGMLRKVKSGSIELWFLPLSSTAQRFGLSTAVSYVLSSAFTIAVVAPSSSFSVVISSQTFKFRNKP